METFIAFFDVLGFKEFIYNNEFKEVKRLFGHLLRDTQTAVAGEKYIETRFLPKEEDEDEDDIILDKDSSSIFKDEDQDDYDTFQDEDEV